jgi:chorismate dehydratase
MTSAFQTRKDGPSADEGFDLIVGRVPFLVCAPFFHSTLGGAEGIRFVDGVPSALNRALHAGTIDCAPSSSIEYGLRHREYKLFPGISTSSKLEMKSVLLLSQEPWEELGGRPVALSPDSDTSNLLFRILCARRFKVRPEIRSAEYAPEGGLAAAVFIGDKALAESLSGRWPHRYDLADVWAKWQGLPFSFGLWMVRREALELKPAVAARFHGLLRDSLASFRADPGKALDAWTRAYPNALPRDHMLAFYETADYGFTPEHRESLERFYRLAFQEGHLPEMPVIETVSFGK